MRKKLGEMLIEAGVLTESGLRSALSEQRRWGGTLGRTLVEMRMVTEEDLVRVLSQQLGLEAVDLDAMKIPQSVLDVIPGELAQDHGVIPFRTQMKFLDVAMSDPTNLGIVDELRIRTQMNIRQYLAGPKMIERALARFYHRGFGTPLHGAKPQVLAGIEVPGAIDLDNPPSRHHDELTLEPDRSPRPAPRTTFSPVQVSPRDAEIDALQHRISQLEALVQRDEEVLRKLLALLVEKGVATREEIVARLQ